MENEVEVTQDEILEMAEEATEVESEEVLVEEEKDPGVAREEARKPKKGKSGKWAHRQKAHVPGPRRKRKFSKAPAPEPDAKKVVPSERSEQANLETPLEKPMTFGSVDG